jgi:predicted TIM-barrel fold metal-dependent hydrolase
MRVDVHQHLWTQPLVDALARRESLPFVRCDEGLCTIHVAGEAPSAMDLRSEQPLRREELLDRDGVDLALVAISSPLGIEALPRPQAQALIEAHLDGVTQLGGRFAAWGPVALDGLRARDVDAVLERDGVVGVSLPAGAFGPRLDHLDAVFERLERLGAPLFVHPGPGRGWRAAEPALDDPLWWPALTAYVAQMQAAWLAFTALARREHPQLRVVFAMLAGGAPLLRERLLARGGAAVELRDPNTFYEISSFGPGAIEAMARWVGPEQLLYGSDRPVVEPSPSGREALLMENAGWLAQRCGVVA